MNNYVVTITSKANEDIAECINFVNKVSPEATKTLLDDIYSSLQSLTTFPERFPIFSMPKSFPFEIRKQVIDGRYIALYSIEDNKIVVYRVLDSRRKFDYLV